MAVVKELQHPRGYWLLQVECDTCGHREMLPADQEQYARWVAGTPIYHAFPAIAASDARFLDSGQCDRCRTYGYTRKEK